MVFLGASLILQQQDKLIWAACLALLGIVAVVYTYARFPQQGGWKWGAALLKILGILLLLFCVLEPLLARKEPKKGANIFLVVGDNSESLQIKAVDAEESRGEQVQKDLVDSEEKGWLKDLNEEFKAVETLGTAELQTLEAQRTEVLTNIQGMLDEQLFELNLNSVK